jgi:acyl-CoA synthetase (NDP forming)
MLDSLFNPVGVAVIGASGKELHIGNRVIKNLLDFGYKGGIYPINPKADEIRGIKAYKSILDVPGQVDVAHMVIPANSYPWPWKTAAKRVSSTSSSTPVVFRKPARGEPKSRKPFLRRPGHTASASSAPTARGSSIPTLMFALTATSPSPFPRPGHISIVALSGGVAEVIHQGFSAMDVGTRIYASNGNACDISIPEIIRYLAEDEGTRVIVTYVEGLRDPMDFLEAVKEAAGKNPCWP